MAARRRPPRKAGLQGVRADPDRARRALAPVDKDVGLDTHIADVVNVVRWESLEGIRLVAHSYAGWPCGAALDRLGDKVASVVWLDAFRPEDGRALIDLVAAPARQTYEDAAANGALTCRWRRDYRPPP